MQLKALMNSISDMALVLDNNCQIHEVNQAVKNQHGEKVVGSLVGNWLGCHFSEWSGGCGRTADCQRCAFRRLVHLTITEGHAFDSVPVPCRIDADFYTATISTSPLGNRALVQIHAMEPII